jgi:hypothetical protein
MYLLIETLITTLNKILKVTYRGVKISTEGTKLSYKFVTFVNKISPLESILSQMNPLYTCSPNFGKINFNTNRDSEVSTVTMGWKIRG